MMCTCMEFLANDILLIISFFHLFLFIVTLTWDKLHQNNAV